MPTTEDVCNLHSPTVKLRAGVNIIKVQPIFTYDSKCIILASGCDIKVYSISSGECILTYNKHKKPIVSLQNYCSNKLQVLTCSQDGVVFRWAISDGKTLKTHKLLKNLKEISAFYAPTDHTWFAIAIGKNNAEYKLYSLKLNSHSGNNWKSIMDNILTQQNAVVFGPSLTFAAAIFENSLKIFNFETNYHHRHLNQKNLISLASHPKDNILATGDELGRIVIWSHFLESNHPTRTMYHWHSLPMADLLFSIEGTHLYSGGGESVFVNWNLHTGTKQTLPRLGLPICRLSVSPDNSYIATTHADNAVKIISSQNDVVQIIQGLTQIYFRQLNVDYRIPTGILYDQRTRSIVLNGQPGHLQFYDLHRDKQLFNLDIVGQNFICQEKDSLIINTDVDKAAIDSKGLWLATVESRDDLETNLEIRLKFWKFEITTQKFTLNTNIFLPHSKKVNCLKFRPTFDSNTDSEPLACTTGNDNRFKIWTFTRGNDKNGSWLCNLMGYFKDLTPGKASFSEDGSLLAVIFKHVITLWVPHTNELKGTLSHPAISEDFNDLTFGSEKDSHLLISHTDTLIVVWNVLSLTVVYRVKCHVQLMVENPLSDIIATFTKHGNLFVFKPGNPKQCLTMKKVSRTPVIAAIFVENSRKNTSEKSCCWQGRSQLYFLNENQEFFALVDRSKDLAESEDSEKPVLHQSSEFTPFGMLQAKRSTTGIKQLKQEFHEIEEEEKYTDLPCPTNVNPVALLDAVLSSLLKPISIQKTSSDDLQPQFDLPDEVSHIETDNEQHGNLDSKAQNKAEFPKFLQLDDFSFLSEYLGE